MRKIKLANAVQEVSTRDKRMIKALKMTRRGVDILLFSRLFSLLECDRPSPCSGVEPCNSVRTILTKHVVETACCKIFDGSL